MNVGDWWRGALIVLVTIAGAAWFLFAEHEIAGTWGYSLDDSWIYATYAKNLATGNGYVFNPGEHVAGATGPLYVFLLALIYFLFQDVVLPAKVMGVACLAASGILLSKTVHRVLPQNRVAPLLAGVLLVASPPLLWGSLSGMEIRVYLLLICLGIYLAITKIYEISFA